MLNNRGSALAGALIGAAILGIMAAAFSTMMVNYQKESQSLAQKLEMLQVSQAINGALTNPSTCGCTFDPAQNPVTADVPKLTFNSNNPPTIPLSQVNSSCAPGAPPLVRTGAQPGAYNITVGSINLVPVSPGAIPASGTYIANLTIDFDPTKSIIARRAVTIPIRATVDVSIPGSAKIIDCATAGNVGIGGSNGISSQAIQNYLGTIPACTGGTVLIGFNPDGSPNCIVPPVPAAGPAPAPAGPINLPGYQTVNINCNNTRSCAASCPTGTVVLACGCSDMADFRDGFADTTTSCLCRSGSNQNQMMAHATCVTP